MDEELKQLDLAIAEARRLATVALEALRVPQAALRIAAADHAASAAARRVDAARHASTKVIASLSDDDLAELRAWTKEQVDLVRTVVDEEVESCDFWIPQASGLSLADVNTYAAALVPRPRDSASGIPQGLVMLVERSLLPLRRGLSVVGLACPHADAEPRLEAALVRAWRAYREAAIGCISRWAEVDEAYQASTARFQEMRWELAGQVDVDALKAKRAAEDSEAEARVVATAAAAARSEASDDESEPDEHERVAAGAFVRTDSETLIPLPG